MSLQNYEVGATVATPQGDGMIVKLNRSARTVMVHGDTWQQHFAIDELEGYSAAELDPQQLDEWFDSPAPTPTQTGLETRSVPCACPCGKSGQCYVNVRGSQRLMHFTNGGCRCREGNCTCVS